MASLESVKDYIQSLNYKEILRLISLYVFVCIGIVGFLLYRHFNLMAQVEQKTKLLNKARQEVQLILTEYDHIKNEKNNVDILLAKDKNFYIQKYYQDTIKGLTITSQSASNLVSGPGPSGYTEESIQINFTKITMKQLCEFLQVLQQTPRVFVKNLDISKDNIEKKINVNVSLATLKPIVETTTSVR